MNYIIMSIATLIFIGMLLLINASFLKQYGDKLKTIPTLYKYRKWLILIPIVIALIVDAVLLFKGYGLLHVSGIGIFQKDRVKISAEVTMVSMYLLLVLASIGFTLQAVYSIALKKALTIFGIIFGFLFVLGFYMAWNLDYSLFNGLTTTVLAF